MTYDSYSPEPALYRLWMREQVHAIAQAQRDSDVQLLAGISMSQKKTLSHDLQVENLQNGLAGLCAGVSAGGKAVEGVAIYADWELSPSDWQVWREWKK